MMDHIENNNWHTLLHEELAEQLNTHLVEGLSEAHAMNRLETEGANRLPEKKPRPIWAIFFSQFFDVMILVLMAAAVLAGFIGEPQDSLVILIVILLNGILGFAQEYRAERALSALRKLSTPVARVVRAGKIREINSDEIVPGDLLLLEAGNFVPADLRLVHTIQFATQEAPLTGESTPVEKHHARMHQTPLPIAEKANMAFQGTMVVRGKGKGVVIATGKSTELGRIAGLLHATEGVRTPLQKRLAQLGIQLSWIIVAICMVVFITGIIRGEAPLLMLMTAVSLAVAAIPEALPAVVAVALALGSLRLVKQHALVRKLAAVETLGSVTTICTDKTGTLTENLMQVENLWLPIESARAELLNLMALNNDAKDSHPPQGDPTEIALLRAAHKGGVEIENLQKTYPRVAELLFDSERACMTTVHNINGQLIAYTKGAPEVIIAGCSQHFNGAPLAAEQSLAKAEEFASEGQRVLACARKILTKIPEEIESIEENMEFLGLVSMIDPPRAKAFPAIRECRAAGIIPIMITGDHPATALAIAKRLEIAQSEEQILTGHDLFSMDDEKLQLRAAHVRVYARVDPSQKIRIVAALQARGEFVAMTGDGINDAPALKKADIGISMGKSGTDIARDASSLVLLDDNFATIVAAVREGRRIYENIRKFIQYALTTNSSELWLIFLAPLLGLPMPLLPIHILWINLLTDGLPGLTLSVEPASRNIMQSPPRPPKESLFGRGLWQHILWVGLLMAGCTLLTQASALKLGLENWQTMVFSVLTLTQLGNIIAIHASPEPALGRAFLQNRWLLAALAITFALHCAALYVPWANKWLHTQPLTAMEFLACFLMASIPFWAVELNKFCRNRSKRCNL